MEHKLYNQLLLAQAKSGKAVEICVTGTSMLPTMQNGDIITVERQDDYAVGDILVFTYKQHALLVHRLLKKSEGRLFCKGDNAFRLEDINPGQVAGKVTRLNHQQIKPCSNRLVTLSYFVNRAFVACRYNAERTKQTPIYQLYQKAIIEKGDHMMIYQKNEAMDYIQTDEASLAVFDPETGDTHFFDETGIDILNSLVEPCDLEMLLTKLCSIYDVTAEQIKEDIQEFLCSAVQKKVIKVL